MTQKLGVEREIRAKITYNFTAKNSEECAFCSAKVLQRIRKRECRTKFKESEQKIVPVGRNVT